MPAIQLKKLTITQKTLDHNRGKYITTQELNRLTADIFAARLKQGNVSDKANIDDVIEKIDFDDKLKNLNKKVPSNKTCTG